MSLPSYCNPPTSLIDFRDLLVLDDHFILKITPKWTFKMLGIAIPIEYEISMDKNEEEEGLYSKVWELARLALSYTLLVIYFFK